MTDILEFNGKRYFVVGTTPDTPEKLEPGDRLVLGGLKVEPDGEGYKMWVDGTESPRWTDREADTVEALAERHAGATSGGKVKVQQDSPAAAAPSKLKSYSGAIISLIMPKKEARQVVLSEDDLPNGSEALGADELHLTLLFLGDKDEVASKETIENIVSKTAEDYSPIKGRLGGVGRFEHVEEDGTNALYASFDSPSLAKLRPDLAERLTNAGVKFSEEHGFTPHVTLAYIPKGAEMPDIKLGNVEMEFSELVLAWGDDHKRFRFSKKNKALSVLESVGRKLMNKDDKALSEGQGEGGTDMCVCPACGHEKERERGTPCAEAKCPQCGEAMGGGAEASKTLGDWAEELGEEAYKAFLGHALESERLAGEEVALLAADELESLVGGWLASTQEGQKAGRRISGEKLNILKEVKEGFDALMDKVKEIIGWGEYTDKQETVPDDWASLLGGSKSGFKSFRGRDGQWRWTAWAASAFEDLEGEFFKTKALEGYVAETYKRNDHGELWFYHIPLRLGDADFTALYGKSRILWKMGVWADNPFAQKAAAYFSQADGWGASVGYKYRPKDREDKAYDWLWVLETSPVPADKAAFPFSRFFSFGGKHMDLTKDQKAKLEEVFGTDWKDVLSKASGESASKKLEDMEWAYKLLKDDDGDLASVLSELLAEEAIAEKAKVNPVQMLKLALGKIKDEAAKGLVQKVIDALEKGGYQYPKPEEKKKAEECEEEEEYGKPKKKKAEKEEEEEYPKPKKAKKSAGGDGGEASEEGEKELPVKIEIEGLDEIVDAVKTIRTKVEEQGGEIAGLKAMLDAGDEERASQKLKKAPPIVAYRASVKGLLDDDKEEEGQEGAKMAADHPLAVLARGTPLGPRGG